MKTITVNVSETVYKEFQKHAQVNDRPTSELIREAMELYWHQRIRPKHSLRELQPLSLGRVMRPLNADDDLLGEMLDG
jgi:Arc/MetJ-type ribon-helix-helix transcriptional regulator